MGNHITKALIATLISSAPLWATEGTNPSLSALQSGGTVRNAEDQFLLGRSYARGEGVSQSYEQAGFWYRKAAEQGNLKAMHNLGVLYLEGRGTPKDEKQGYELIRKAAEAGDPKSTTLLGILLCRGTGVPKNEHEGISWLERGVNEGNPEALVFLARTRLQDPSSSLGTLKEAIVLLEKAADKGDTAACGELADVLAKPPGALQADAERSAFYARKGAELGDPYCRYLHARKLMVTSPRAAYPWAKLAKEDHVATAVGLYQECLSVLRPEDLVEADAEADRIRAAAPGNR